MKKYTKDHLWIDFHENNSCSIGITSFGCEQMNGIVFVEPPIVGTKFNPDELLAVLESTKTTHLVIIPFAGTVADVLKDSPDKTAAEIMDAEPENTAICRLVDCSVPDSLELLTADEYREFLNNGKDI